MRDSKEDSMTTPDERTRSLLQAGAFLKELATDPLVPPAIRQEASRLLRHFPKASTVRLLARMEAKHFGSNLLSTDTEAS
ncbi:BPSL0761 family protein [Frateuria edaphi]|jgi:hypothetical protein|uniref:BPSL0761 family protein n=1 Tax=Frateuria edaphi TaxID=2898793 RepID=UPI0030845F8D